MTDEAPLSSGALLAAIRASTTDLVFERMETPDGVPSLRAERNGRGVWLHSQRYPLKEAQKIISGLDFSSGIIVVAGFGLGYHVEALRRNAAGSIIAVLEKERGVLAKALEIRPGLQHLFNDPSIVFFSDADGLIAWLQEKANRSMAWLIHRPSFELYPEFYSNFKTLLLSFHQKRNINIATLSRFEKIWARNIVRNISSFLSDPGVSEHFGKFKGRPFVLVGAGPSLDASLGFLREAAKKSVILAVDSVLPRLLSEGIEPDFVFSVDPQLLNFYFFYLCRKKLTSKLKTILVYEPSCHFLIPRRWPGRRMTFDSIFPLIQWVSEVTGEKGKLDMGGSVSTTAFDFAVACGADPVVLVGQDMAFDRDKTHGRGSLVEYVLLKQNNRTATMETRSHRLTFSNVAVKVNSNAGRSVTSDRRLLLFYWWFAEKMKTVNASTRVISVAPNGAAVKGIAFLQQDKALALLSEAAGRTAGMDLFHDTKNKGDSRETLAKAAVAMAGSMRGLSDVAKRAEELSLRLYDLVKIRSKADRSVILKELDAIDRTIETRKKENRLIGITMQKILFSITEGADDFLTGEEKADKNLSVAKRSLVLYREIARGAAYNLRLLEDLGKELT